MSTMISVAKAVDARAGSATANALADRLEQGARALADLARNLTPAEWETRMPGDGRTIGVIVHHVASVYPIEVQLALQVAEQGGITNVTMDDVHKMNAGHAAENSGVSADVAVRLLERNSEAAAARIRGLSAEELAAAGPVSLYNDAPVTCQFVLEDHAVRHSYHHLKLIKRVVGK